MSQQKQAPLPRQEFQEWLENAAVPVLVLQKGKHLGSVVKVPATPEIDYLFGCETFYGERISWSDRLEFCGLYDRQHQALHLLDDPLPNFVSGLTEEECQDSTAFGKRIAQEVDRYVEAAISNERSRLSVRELTSERNINSYRGGIEVSTPVAGDGDAIPPQGIDHVSNLNPFDAEGQFQLPAGGGVESSHVVLLQIFRQPFFLHECLLSGPVFRKRA